LRSSDTSFTATADSCSFREEVKLDLRIGKFTRMFFFLGADIYHSGLKSGI